MSIVAVMLPLIILFPPFNSFSGQAVWMDGLTNAGVYVLLALGLNIVVGMSGLLDLGYAAFFAIGAYSMAFAASSIYNNDISFWPMLLVGALTAAVFGLLLGAPTLRLRGDYLAIVTLGFGGSCRSCSSIVANTPRVQVASVASTRRRSEPTTSPSPVIRGPST